MSSVRVAAHVHSVWSDDGSWTLDAIARSFIRRRYDAILMSEHDRGFDPSRWDEYQRACARVSEEQRILLVPGIEYQDGDNVVHVPVWGIDVPFLGESRPTLELLSAASDAGAVAVFAHPWRQDALARYRSEWAPHLCAVEVWNRKYDGIAPRRIAWELARREMLMPFVSLDFHTRRQFFPLAMSMDIEGSLTASALMAAMHAGQCRPQALGLSALRFTRGLEGLAAGALEAIRRTMAQSVRAARPNRRP